MSEYRRRGEKLARVEYSALVLEQTECSVIGYPALSISGMCTDDRTGG